jgi:hypothetical protein
MAGRSVLIPANAKVSVGQLQNPTQNGFMANAQKPSYFLEAAQGLWNTGSSYLNHVFNVV